jgi:drug/metabolite transporter (DMT)-like permease
MTDRTRGAAAGLLAALLFGASAPVSKLLLHSVSPLMLSGLLYLGAGLGLTAYRLAVPQRSSRHAPLRRGDLPLLAGIVLSGGIGGPLLLLLLLGLTHVSGVAGSLLLNLEGVFTLGLAVLLFGEHLGRGEALAAGVILLGAAGLGLRGDPWRADGLGMLEIALACLCWGVDNNLTQRLSLKDPTAVVRLKTLLAGTFTFGLSLLLGHRLPMGALLGAGLLLGAVSYGTSIVLDLYALRYLGAAREAAFFAVAPFAGALLAIPLLRELPTAVDVAAAAAMILGVVLLLRARHAHLHRHEPLEHEHEHVHDAHHTHSHEGPVVEPHSHRHRHEALEHDHPHASDLHHRHSH